VRSEVIEKSEQFELSADTVKAAEQGANLEAGMEHDQAPIVVDDENADKDVGKPDGKVEVNKLSKKSKI